MSDELQSIERDLLLEAVRRYYGYDFRDYAESTLDRGIACAMAVEGVASISALQERVLRDGDCLNRLVAAVCLRASSLFREPAFFRGFRQRVAPLLRTYPSVRIWIAGCSSGEEVYATAIALKECGVYERSRIYATELSESLLVRARQGAYSLAAADVFRKNYRESGGSGELAQYYQTQDEQLVFRRSLLENVTFAQHNLACDGAFNEFNVILCRNALQHYRPSLRERAFRLFRESLCRLGVLGLGQTDSPNETEGGASSFKALAGALGLYRRML